MKLMNTENYKYKLYNLRSLFGAQKFLYNFDDIIFFNLFFISMHINVLNECKREK